MLYLTARNTTTREEIKKQYIRGNQGFIYSRGSVFANWNFVFRNIDKGRNTRRILLEDYNVEVNDV